MGAGKTSWAIQEMDAHPEESYIFATPFLDEIKRIKKATRRHFCDPQQIDGRKLEGFNRLLMSGKDIALTHATFSNANSDTLKYVEQGNYTLILDEALDILIDFNKVATNKLKKGDPKFLIKEGCISVDKYGQVSWLKDTYQNAAYSEVERLAKSGNLYYLDNALLVWRFPPSIFKLFKEVYVLTYLFQGSFLKPYFECHGLPYELVSVNQSECDTYALVPYSRSNEEREKFKRLITICKNTEMNNYKAGSLSKTWYTNANKKAKEELRKDISNYFKNIVKAKSAEIMWTVPKEQETCLKGPGYTTVFRLTKDMPMINCPGCNAHISHRHSICPICGEPIKIDKKWLESERKRLEKQSKCFVPCNARATNDYADRWALAYCCNMYANQYEVRYFQNKQTYDGISVKFDENYYALSCMLQWIWRSRIRRNEPIHVYIPSTRMRNLLIDWLDGKM